MKSILALVVLFLSVTVNTAWAARWEADFRRGIKTQDEWLERFRSTFDHRILYLLSHRRGFNIDLAKAKQMAQALKEEPNQIDPLFERWGLLRDGDEEEKAARETWDAAFGDQAIYIESDNYLTMATKKDEAIVKQLSFYLERIFTFYDNSFPFDERIAGRFVVKFHPNRASFVQEGAPGHAFAFFSSRTRRLVGYAPQGKDPEWDRHTLIHTFFHEAFHQFISYYVPNVPMWLNEGFADFFASALVNKRTLKMGKSFVVAGELQQLQQVIKAGRSRPLVQLVRLNYQQFYDPKTVGLNYSQAWALVWFMTQNARLQPIYQDLFQRLANAEHPDIAMQESFGKVDWNKLEQAYRKWVIKQKLPRDRDRYVQPR